MNDDDLVKFAWDFRESVLDGRESNWACSAVSTPLVALLNGRGVVCEMVESDLGHCNHYWIRLEDGRALDATADQFNRMFFMDLPAVYLGEPLIIHATPESLDQLLLSRQIEPNR